MEIRVRDRLLDGHAAGKDLATYGVLRQREEPPGLEVVLRVIAVVRALHKTIALGDVLPDEALGRAERPSSLLRDLGEHVFEHHGRGDGGAGVDQGGEPPVALLEATPVSY